MNEKRVACFFTCGFTELNSMKSFMRRINDRLKYVQLCPVGSRKSKDMIRRRHVENIKTGQNGLTGQSLIDFVLDFVQKERFKEEAYDAILIEDDKDDRFLSVQVDGTAILDVDEWKRFQQNVRDKLGEFCPGVPVILFFAAPEVEAWFLSDWDNSFGKVYMNVLNSNQNKYFSFQFRKHINEQILTHQYSNSIESYGYFDGTYRKLSEEIQNSLDANDFLVNYRPTTGHEPIRYSKRDQGETMLEEIDPQIVAEKCPIFFKGSLLELQRL